MAAQNLENRAPLYGTELIVEELAAIAVPQELATF